MRRWRARLRGNTGLPGGVEISQHARFSCVVSRHGGRLQGVRRSVPGVLAARALAPLRIPLRPGTSRFLVSSSCLERPAPSLSATDVSSALSLVPAAPAFRHGPNLALCPRRSAPHEHRAGGPRVGALASARAGYPPFGSGPRHPRHRHPRRGAHRRSHPPATRAPARHQGHVARHRHPRRNVPRISPRIGTIRPGLAHWMIFVRNQADVQSRRACGERLNEAVAIQPHGTGYVRVPRGYLLFLSKHVTRYGPSAHRR